MEIAFLYKSWVRFFLLLVTLSLFYITLCLALHLLGGDNEWHWTETNIHNFFFLTIFFVVIVLLFVSLHFFFPLLAHLPMVLFILTRETGYKTHKHTRNGYNKSIDRIEQNKMCSELIKWVSRWKSFLFKLESIAIFQFALFELVFFFLLLLFLILWVSMDFFLKLSLCHGFDAKASSCSTRSDLFCQHHHHSDPFDRTNDWCHWI